MKCCARCGAENGVTARFCAKCGAKMEAPSAPVAPQAALAPSAGARFPKESEEVFFHCKACGQRVEASSDMAGQQFGCPGCGKPLVVPVPQQAKARRGAERVAQPEPRQAPALQPGILSPTSAASSASPLLRLRPVFAGIGAVVVLSLIAAAMVIFCFPRSPRGGLSRPADSAASEVRRMKLTIRDKTIYAGQYPHMLSSYDAAGEAAGTGAFSLSGDMRNTIMDISDIPEESDPWSPKLGVQCGVGDKQVALVTLRRKLCSAAYIDSEGVVFPGEAREVDETGPSITVQFNSPAGNPICLKGVSVKVKTRSGKTLKTRPVEDNMLTIEHVPREALNITVASSVLKHWKGVLFPAYRSAKAGLVFYCLKDVSVGEEDASPPRSKAISADANAQQPETPKVPPHDEPGAWESAARTGTPTSFAEYFKRYPDSPRIKTQKGTVRGRFWCRLDAANSQNGVLVTVEGTDLLLNVPLEEAERLEVINSKLATSGLAKEAIGQSFCCIFTEIVDGGYVVSRNLGDAVVKEVIAPKDSEEGTLVLSADGASLLTWDLRQAKTRARPDARPTFVAAAAAMRPFNDIPADVSKEVSAESQAVRVSSQADE